MTGAFSPLIPPNHILLHEGLRYFASIPGLLQSVKSSKENNANLARSPISSYAKQIRLQMMSWYRRLETTSEQPPRKLLTPAKSYHILEGGYSFRDPITAAFMVNYCAYLILINQSLDLLARTMLYSEENQRLARDIGMATFYCSKAGFCGAQAMALTLPIALTAASEQDVGWIQECMRIFTDLGHTLVLRSTIKEKIKNDYYQLEYA